LLRWDSLWGIIRHIMNDKPIIFLRKKASQASLKGIDCHILPHKSNNYLEKIFLPKYYLPLTLLKTIRNLARSCNYPVFIQMQLMQQLLFVDDLENLLAVLLFQTGRFCFEQKLEEKKKNCQH